MSEKIPVVDLKKASLRPSSDFENEDLEEFGDVAVSIEAALSKVGFVYLVNHGISDDTINNAFVESEKFFKLPSETKLKYLMSPESDFHGYSSPGMEKLGKGPEFREMFDYRFPWDAPGRSHPDGDGKPFDDAMNQLRRECTPLLNFLLRIIARALGFDDKDFFLKASTWLNSQSNSCKTYTIFRSNFYPAVKCKNVPEDAVRIGAHSDYCIVTLLFQDMIGGLEVKSVDGCWMEAKPIPGSILVNTGDLLEYWSSGYFPATPHRVPVPSDIKKLEIPRQSIALFCFPDDNIVVQPVAERDVEITEGKEITIGEFIREKIARIKSY